VNEKTMKMKNLTVLGGGTGSFTLLSGLREHPEMKLDSIVTMMDSGGDSGRLRDEHGILPPGDIRRCIVALSGQRPLLRELFNFRFNEASLNGRSFGNLFYLALTRILKDESKAIEAMAEILQISGRVIPVTLDHAHLVAELEDGSIIRGEGNIDTPKHDTEIPIRRVFLDPAVRSNPDACHAILNSDMVVLAPGNLYTSTIPNLLVGGIPEAIQSTRAPLAYVVNLMTMPGETDNFCATDHVQVIARYAGRMPDVILVRSTKISPGLLRNYRREGSKPVKVDPDRLRSAGVGLVWSADIASETSLVRHDPARTAQALKEVLAHFAGSQPQRLAR